MRKLRRFFALPSDERRVLIAAAGRLVVARILLSTIGVSRTRSWLARNSATRIDGASAARIAESVVRIAPHLPIRTNCLDRAVALWWLLASRGLAADLRLGIRKKDDASLGAHAWVEHAGVVLLDDEAAHYLALDAPMLASGER